MKFGVLFSNRRLAALLALPALACVSAACSDSSPDAGGADRSAGSGSVHVVATEKVSLVPTFVRGNFATLTSAVAPTESEVRTVLPSIAAVLHASGDFTLKSTQSDPSGETHYRYTQHKNGLEVLGGEVVVHVKDGVVNSANGNARSDLPAPTAAKISAKSAAVNAVASYPSTAQVSADPASDLAYWRETEGDALQLVHRLTVRGVDEDGELVDVVLVDAVGGKVVDRIPTIMTVKTRAVYDANQSSSSKGTLKRSEGEAATSDDAVNASYDNTGATYDVYKALFDRDSIDGKGMTLTSSVHATFCTDIFCFGKTKNNASWSTQDNVMRYGDGDGSTFSNLSHSLDVTGHELTHGVTFATSALTYSGQSGGLNEGISDIFGAVVQWYQAGKEISDGVWQVGEDVYTPGTSGDALRYMNDPAKDGSSIDYAPDYNNQNVHYTSGVPNLAFYLLSQGGTHPRNKTTVNVTGIGIEKAAQIYYLANTTILTSSATYANARTATEQAATKLGYTTSEIASVSNSWAAVGVGSAVSE